jgi:4-amino-4-deoxy-L-arabinose transferase-like glycosyltransferase
MASLSPPTILFGRAGRWPGPLLAAMLTLFACATFMFVGRWPPIVIWDESRLAVNALEMHMRGFSLVTTYGFLPDNWNTKPPLAIWLMDAAIALCGRSEFAIRLPSMMAALATLGIVFAFTRRATHAVWPAALAALMLTMSVGFYGEHGARTGDYDATLCLFTTGYNALFYRSVHRRRAGWPLLLIAAALVAAALMTKSIAGLMPGTGVAFYLLATGRLRRVAGDPRYYASLLLALVPITAFYVAREYAAPGYLHAVWYNDIAGRYTHALGNHSGPPWYYVELILLDWFFSAGSLLLILPFGLIQARGQQRQALLFALCCIAGELAAISTGGTKLAHYAMPALPWIAIAVAISLHALLPMLRRATKSIRAAVLLLALLFAAKGAAQSAMMRYVLLAERQYHPQAGYGALLEALHGKGVTRVLLIEPGITAEHIVHYAPQLDFYARLWTLRGMDVRRALTIPDGGRGTLASCDPGIARMLIARGGKRLGFAGCGALIENP